MARNVSGDGDEKALARVESSTAIAAFNPAVLQPESDIAEALRVNLSVGGVISPSILPKVTFPAAGGTTWGYKVNGIDFSERELIGVPVYFGPRVTLWPTDEPSGGRPVLISNDGITAIRVSDDIGDLDPEVLEAARTGDRTYLLERLAYAKFGSGRNGRGRRIRESRVLCLLREDDAWPLLVQFPAMSVQPMTLAITQLPVPYYQAVVGISLHKEANPQGKPYAVADMRLVSRLTREQGKALAATYGEALRKMFSSAESAAID